jgi:TetR/AcrR family transcriptional regulator, cholesterol catabolism regulator
VPPRPARLVDSPPLPQDLAPAQAARRARIVAAGLRLLQSSTYDQVQMRDVAEQAGVAIGTVYHYFQSKEHLFAEVLAEWASSLRDHMDRTPARGETNAERLQEVLHRSVRAFQSRPQLVRVLMTLEASSDPYAAEIFARMNASIQRVYGEALVGLPDDVSRVVVKVAGATLDLLLRQWVVGRMSIAEVYDQLAKATWLMLEFREGDDTPVP